MIALRKTPIDSLKAGVVVALKPQGQCRFGGGVVHEAPAIGIINAETIQCGDSSSLDTGLGQLIESISVAVMC